MSKDVKREASEMTGIALQATLQADAMLVMMLNASKSDHPEVEALMQGMIPRLIQLNEVAMHVLMGPDASMLEDLRAKLG